MPSALDFVVRRSLEEAAASGASFKPLGVDIAPRPRNDLESASQDVPSSDVVQDSHLARREGILTEQTPQVVPRPILRQDIAIDEKEPKRIASQIFKLLLGLDENADAAIYGDLFGAFGRAKKKVEFARQSNRQNRATLEDLHKKEIADIFGQHRISDWFAVFFNSGRVRSGAAGAYFHRSETIEFPDDFPAGATVVHEIYHALDFSDVFTAHERKVMARTRLNHFSFERKDIGYRGQVVERDAEIYEYYWSLRHSGGTRNETLMRKELKPEDKAYFDKIDPTGEAREVWENIMNGKVGARTHRLRLMKE